MTINSLSVKELKSQPTQEKNNLNIKKISDVIGRTQEKKKKSFRHEEEKTKLKEQKLLYIF